MPARRQATKKDSTSTSGFVAKHLTPHGMAVPPCGIALFGQLFYSTQIPVCLWFFWGNEPVGKCRAVSELVLALPA